MPGSTWSFQRLGFESGSEAGKLPVPQREAGKQPLRDGGSAH